ncbi:hypothetical protein Vadar_000823 [Vaccinium darrowii]|uniref:Uncharacterized protein n=1 Tax=Vaccinium darrowii TaxID=229202 RepID=A0ACB7Y4Q8_9ERIC|nr:hypothetical protein Vadar_000823 [Vaccinium darrowii]
MGFPSFLALFLVSHHLLVLLQSSASCPSSFDCGTLGPVKFPFTNTTYPQCGLCTLNCDEPVPKVTLSTESRSFQLRGFTDEIIKIDDSVIKALIESSNCDFYSYNIPFKTASISFTVSPNVSFFKCLTSSPELENQADKHFLGNYTRYRGCQGYTVYYAYPDNRVPNAGSYPPTCVLFQLPVVSSIEGRNLSDPFRLLASNFSIRYYVSKECYACHLNGGQCLRDFGEFQCLNKRGRSNFALILGTVVSTVGLVVIFLLWIITKKLAQSESTFFWKSKTENSKNIELDWEALCQIAVGIARGLEYLHRGCNTRILHLDIKPHNILLNENFCPKISDFGLAKLCLEKESIISLLGARGTTGYIAPEVFSRNFGGVSHKSDVYSYGMMVLEMVGGRKSTSVEVDHTSEIYFPHWVYKRLELDEDLGLHGIMDDEPKENVRKMIIVGLWCIQTNPSHRPSMSRVLEMLEGSPESLQIPPKPFLFSPSRSSVDSSSALMS